MSELPNEGNDNHKRKKRAALASGRFELGTAQLDAVLNNAAIGMTVSDLDGQYLFVNEVFAHMIGYDPKSLSGMSYRDIVHPEDILLQESRLAALKSSRSVVDLAKRYIHKDGRIIWVKETVTYIRERGSNDRVAAIVRDLSAEHVAREEERRMRFLADNSSDYISLSDALGRISYMNKAGRTMVGLSSDATELGTSADYSTPEELDRVLREVLPQINSAGFWEGDLKLRHLISGEEIPVHVKSLQIRDSLTGKPEGRATLARDRRPEIAAREVIQERENRLRSAVEMAGLGTWNIDLVTGKVYFSERVGELYGQAISPLDVQGLSGVHPEDKGLVRSALEDALKPGSVGIYDSEHRTLNQQTGKVSYVHSQGRVLYRPSGEPYMLIGTLQDITGQEQARQALEQQVKAHAAELSKANQQLQDLNSFLQQSNAELEQYAYVASHDLQEPLRKISVFAGMLCKLEGMPPLATAAVEKINVAATRMKQLIGDLLDFSRLLKGERLLQPVDLSHTLNNVLLEFSRQIREKEAVIESDPLPIIEAIPLQMHQLLFNLIGNSMKFVAEDVAPHIAVRCRKLNEGEHAVHGLQESDIIYYFITITDNGIGFDSQYAEQIFEVFKRLHTQRTYPGSGIGLALCRRILQNHGGIMTAQSREGVGTTISMIIPSRQLPQ